MLITKTKSDYPVDVATAKKHIRLDTDFTDDDSYIGTLITVATRLAENTVGFDIAYTTNVYKKYDYSGDVITINEGNINLDASILVQDENDSYYSINQSENFFHYFTLELSSSITADHLTVTFQTGYDGDCPEDIKQAILIKTADLYDQERNSWHAGGLKNDQVFERMLEFHKSYYV